MTKLPSIGDLNEMNNYTITFLNCRIIEIME